MKRQTRNIKSATTTMEHKTLASEKSHGRSDASHQSTVKDLCVTPAPRTKAEADAQISRFVREHKDVLDALAKL